MAFACAFVFAGEKIDLDFNGTPARSKGPMKDERLAMVLLVSAREEERLDRSVSSVPEVAVIERQVYI